MANFLEIIPIIKAQTLDAAAQPTFGNITVSGGGGTTSSILLSSNKTSVNVGERFTVSVEIKTNSTQIEEFKIVVEYDPSKFSVVDQDSSTDGTQSKLVDTMFKIENQGENNAANNGRVVLHAKTVSGNAISLNKKVAEIEFQSQSETTSSIKVAQGTQGSQLIRSNGSSIAFVPNEVNITSSQVESNTSINQSDLKNTDYTLTSPTFSAVTGIVIFAAGIRHLTKKIRKS